MRYPAMGAVFARGSAVAGLLALFLVPSLLAQVHGTPPSVTSFGFGGRHNPAPGVPASVTSLGRFGWNGGHRTGFGPACCVNTFRNHHRRAEFFSGYAPLYGYSVPYGTEYFDDTVDESPPDEYLGGPTIFDRRGPGPGYGQPDDRSRGDEARSGVRSRDESPEPQTQEASEVDQPQTVLIFKDGHKLEVQNYAIVGDTLYNLGATRGRKIALADLDVKATVRENDDRGIDFRLPPGAAGAQVN